MVTLEKCYRHLINVFKSRPPFHVLATLVFPPPPHEDALMAEAEEAALPALQGLETLAVSGLSPCHLVAEDSDAEVAVLQALAQEAEAVLMAPLV